MGFETLLMAFLVGVLYGKASRFVRVCIRPCGGKINPHIVVSISGTAVMNGRTIALGTVTPIEEAVS